MTDLPHIEPGKPFVLPGGVEVRPAEEGQGATVVTPEELEAEDELEEELLDPFEDAQVEFRRTLADVRLSAKQFNPIMLVLAYSMWGLDVPAIARLLEIEQEAVEAVMQNEMYSDTRKQMLEAIRYAESGTIHGYLTQKAKRAAVVMGGLLNSKLPDIKMAAAKDILDRANFRPVDRVEHVHKFEDELRIVRIEEKAPPKIEVEI